MAAPIRTGASSLLAAVKELDRLYRKYTAGPLVRYTEVADFAVLLQQLSETYQEYAQADDFPGEGESTLPLGPEDS